MSWFPLVLVVVSAFCHAGWNFIGKKSVPYLSFFTLVSFYSSLLLLPVALYFLPITMHVFDGYLPWVIATGLFQAFYFMGLSGGYRGYELSVVYPLARALPVAFVPIAVSLFDRDHYTLLQYTGVILIVIGCLLVPFKGKSVFIHSLKSKGILFALLAALATTGYSYIDQYVLNSVAIDLTHFQSWQRALVYMFWLSVSATVWVGILSVFSIDRAEQWRITLTSQRLSSFSTACGMAVTYSLVLIAMNYTEHVGQVVALRQLSIPIGVAMGVIWLNEAFNGLKLFGLVLLMAGIYLVL